MMRRLASTLLVPLGLLAATEGATALDLKPLWDFNDPAASELRFRAALEAARGDDALILQTQIARTHGLRKQFATARQLLHAMEEALSAAGPEARARHALELGRTYASAAHPAGSVDAAAKEIARGHFERALQIAKHGRLDGLAIDAIHMLAFVDTTPSEQLKWAQEALAVVETSTQPEAKAWEASIRNNLGHALHQLGRYDDALVQFRQALAIRERGTNAPATRVARWMVAWTLRSLGRADEALEIQLRLERECDAAQAPDAYVYEELEALYRAKGDDERAAHYRARQRSLKSDT